MEVNETRNCLVFDNRLNTFENGKTQLFNSGGVVKWAKISKNKKWSIPLNCLFCYWEQLKIVSNVLLSL